MAGIKGSTAPKRTRPAEADGRRMAIDMLKDLQDTWLGDADGENDEWRRDPVTVRTYLSALLTRESEAAEFGFAAVLTDFIGNALERRAPSPWEYDHGR